MDKEFAEVFKEEIVNEGKIEELGKQIAGLAHKFKEGKDDVMTMADEMITNGAMPDPEMIKMLETEEADMVIHLIAKKMGVQWTKDNGYGEMRFKQNYPESYIKKNADRLIEMSKRIKEEVEIDEANLNDYVAKFKQKMGKTTYQTMTDWVDGIGGLTKKEISTLKRTLKPFTEASTYRDKAKDEKKKKQFAFGGKKKSRHGASGYGKGEEVKVDEVMNPKDHVKEKDGKFVVIAPSGKVVYSSNDKKEAEEWAVKNHDALMKEEVGVDGRTKGFKEALRRLTYEKLRKMKQEGIDIQKADMKDVIKDFQTSDAPQFKGKSDKKKKEMAIAAKLSKEENEDDEPVGKKKKKSNKDVINLKPTAESSMKKFKDIMTKLKEKRFNDVKETTDLKKEKVEVEESDGYEVDLAAKKIQHKWKKMSKAEKVRFLDKMDVLAGKTKVSDSDLEDILGDYGLFMEASGGKEAYQKFFNGVLKKFGVKSPSQLKGDKKKEFFDYIDKNWTADHEEETKKEETMTKKSLKDAVSNMKEKKLKVQEAITIGGVEVGEQDFDKEQRLDHAAPNLGMTYADYQAKFKTDGLEGPYQIDGGAYFWDKAATKWFSVETEDYVDQKRNAELNFRYTKQGTAGGGLMHNRRL